VNSCRWAYNLYAENSSSENKYFLEETSRRGELLPIEEDDHGTYIMNARDLCAIQLIDKMIAAGINGLKIEGRTKSIYYVSVITRAYRSALEKINEGKKIDEAVINEIYAVANRGYTSSFLEHPSQQNFINFEAGHSNNYSHVYCGAVRDIDKKSGLIRIAVRNQIKKGDLVEIISPGENHSFLVNDIYSLKGKPIDIAHGGGEDVQIKITVPLNKYSLIRKLNDKTI
jgi:putative protease